MTLNEIKKALYTQKPTADRNYIIKLSDVLHKYTTHLTCGKRIEFMVPESDMGEGRFEDTMPAHLLIRWIVI